MECRFIPFILVSSLTKQQTEITQLHRIYGPCHGPVVIRKSCQWKNVVPEPFTTKGRRCLGTYTGNYLTITIRFNPGNFSPLQERVREGQGGEDKETLGGRGRGEVTGKKRVPKQNRSFLVISYTSFPSEFSRKTTVVCTVPLCSTVSLESVDGTLCVWTY